MKIICWLAAAVVGLVLIGPVPTWANNCELPFDQNGKLAVVLQVDGCTLEVKASTDLHNACGEVVSVSITNAVSLVQVGFLVFGDEGSCLVASDTDAAGNAVQKAECASGGHTKISLTASSCIPAPV
jgi:hypothetical protein